MASRTGSLSKPALGTIFQLACLAALGLLAALSADQALRVRRALRDADATPRRPPYQYRALRAQRRVLVVGDSTGVGVGAECPTHSIAGLLAAEFKGAEVVNLSVSGSTLNDVPAQLRQLDARGPRFDVVLLHVGGNDILRSPNFATMQQAAEVLMPRLHEAGERVIWLGSGDIGLAPLFRPPFSWWLSRRSRQACELFRRVAQAHGVEYVGFHEEVHRDVVACKRNRFFAGDGLHPNSHGYRYCYGWLMRSVSMKQMLEQLPSVPTDETIELAPLQLVQQAAAEAAHQTQTSAPS
jgi:lysophospholipase L1-like esterase